MKRTSTNLVIMAIFLVSSISLIGWGKASIFGGRGGEYEETLTITAAGGRDSTAVTPGSRHMTLSVLPGYTTSDPDSFSANKDSSDVDVYIRGWADKQRTHCMGSIQLFDPFQLQMAATIGNSDSATKTVSMIGNLYAAETAGTGSWDSTRVHLTRISNLQTTELWPWVDVMILDNDTLTGKNSAYKIKLFGYND